MREFKIINPRFSVSAQIEADDLARARDQGFHTVIDNRPDNETGVEYASLNAETDARAVGLEFIYQPTENHLIYNDQSVDGFIDALDGQSAPVLAYCKSGTRCVILWALAASRFQPAEQVFEYLMENGFEDFDTLDEDMADQSRRYFEDASVGVVVPEIFRLDLGIAQTVDQGAIDRSKAA